ncbi:ABC transporter substrate-binding protein [Amorphus sp. 3PC139-8]|uniref:ABC transporter substrate-binding protein n=1 Tax=Amorphus sp. 3PC139-8 TaxID=2735676 RepID=UPI00345D0710
MKHWKTTALAVGLATVVGGHAVAADLVRVASSQRGFWDQTLIQFGDDAGIFDKHDIDLEILWTDGGADAQQSVISGSMDVAVGTGALGVISAWAKGAPIDVIGASMTGSSDLFWYVKADSDIKSIADAAGRTVSFSRPGSSTNLIAAKLVAAADVDAELVPTGGPAATMTQVMSDQIDVGWSAVPIGLDREASGDIRIIASGNDAPGVAEQSVRYHVVNRNFLEQNPDVIKRFLAAYQETLDWAYDSDEALQMWADMNDLTMEEAKSARDRGYPREALQPFPIKGTDQNVQEAVENDRLDEPLTEEQVSEFLSTAEEVRGSSSE